jgi:Calcineurin-like phosphoesterase
MTDDFSYRDPTLSIWQAAAQQVHARRSLAEGMTLQSLRARPVQDRSQDPLMVPAHLVARAAKDAGKPFAWLAQEVKKGFLDLKALFDPDKDCANAAAHFLWAELSGNEHDSELYEGELSKAVCDVGGWSACLSTYLGYRALGEKPQYRPNQNVIVDLGTKSRLAIIGDWGVGDAVSINVLQEVKKLNPDVLLHLGDVYYAGTQREAKVNFLDICQSLIGNNIPIYTLCGNHDMYSGGAGYYWLLDQIGQKASYFCLKNDNWMFLAMDTGFHDNNPFNVATNMTQLVSQDGWSEADWHMKQINNAGNRKLVLLSHHQLFSPFSSVGSVNGQAYAYNPNLYGVFKDTIPKAEWWFWGHEHTLGIFPPYMGLKRGRCVGASAVPVFQDQQSYATCPTNLQTLDGTMPTWDPKGVLGISNDMYNNCFAMMRLTGTSATVEYYEVPLLKPAVRFPVTDVCKDP